MDNHTSNTSKSNDIKEELDKTKRIPCSIQKAT